MFTSNYRNFIFKSNSKEFSSSSVVPSMYTIHEIPALTGIRALAAFWVVSIHLQPWLHTIPSLKALTPFFESGAVGVDIFFVLSGFILFYNYSNKLSKFVLSEYLKFIGLRFSRIFPVHLFTLLLLLVMVLIFGPLGEPKLYTYTDFVRNLFLVHAWAVPLFNATGSWNFPSWSISAEWFAYLLFPLFLWISLRVRRQVVFPLIVISLILLLGLVYMASKFNALPTTYLIRIIFEFLIGCLVCRIFSFGYANHLNWGTISICSATGLLLFSYVLQVFHISELLAVPFGVLLIWSLAYGEGPLVRLLSGSVLLYLGRASFAVYMLHGIIVAFLHEFLPPEKLLRLAAGSRIVLLLGVFCSLIVGAILLYHFVEEPCRKFLRKRLTKKKFILQNRQLAIS
jgi:peptidoglycan/LPS O-acetylase OafA/YrhL